MHMQHFTALHHVRRVSLQLMVALLGDADDVGVHEQAAYMRMCSTVLVCEMCTAFGMRESVWYILMHLNEVHNARCSCRG